MSRSQGTEKGESEHHGTSEALVRFSSRCLNPLLSIRPPPRGLLVSGDDELTITQATPSVTGSLHIQFCIHYWLFLAIANPLHFLIQHLSMCLDTELKSHL